MEGSSVPNLVGLGAGAAVLGVAVRTFLAQQTYWRGLLDAAVSDAKQARADADDARTQAAGAVEDARQARAETALLRATEADCRTQLAELWLRIRELEQRHEGD